MADETQQGAGPAATQVFTTVELREAILLEVDMKTLLLAQRVYRTWQATIKDCIKLQEKLWFRTPSSVSSSSELELNPLLFRAKSRRIVPYAPCTDFITPSVDFIQPVSNQPTAFSMIVQANHATGKNILDLNRDGSWQQARLFKQAPTWLRIFASYMERDIQARTSLLHLPGIYLSDLPSITAGELVERFKERLAKSKRSKGTRSEGTSTASA